MCSYFCTTTERRLTEFCFFTGVDSRDSSALQELLPEVVIAESAPLSPRDHRRFLPPQYDDINFPPTYYSSSSYDVTSPFLIVTAIEDVGEDTLITVEINTRSAGKSKHEVMIRRGKFLKRSHNDECPLAYACFFMEAEVVS
ncbi:hypothetical protein [Candidatus Ichthyocystis sparus]|uniref:hypothetical protein n=1 Tax=Candidatus Ichthyocystis sparus TaxID=1561004 RepID=UPI000A716D02|nr:hypothetical protein [Candidatus Ichthyocystis sparus]